MGLSALFSSVPPLYYGMTRPSSIQVYLKQDIEQAVDEFETVKRILSIVFPIVLIINALYYSTGSYFTITTGNSRIPLGLVLFIFLFPITSIGIGGLIMYIKIISPKEFRFNLSKACFRIAQNKVDAFKQMYYFGLGLQEYNKCLKRNFKRQIKDINKIFSKVSILDNDARNRVIRSLSISFDSEIDKLKPLNCITSELMKSEDAESILIQETLKSQLKVVGAFLAASIPLVISTLTLLHDSRILGCNR